MVRRVSKNDVDEGTGARAEAICSPNSSPRGWRNTICECQCAGSLQFELRYEFIDGAQIELSLWHVACLIKAGQGRRVVAADPKQPVGKDSLCVEEVADDFLDSPLSIGVPEHGARVAQPSTEGPEFECLRLKVHPDPAVRKRRKEVSIERCGFLSWHPWEH